MAGHKLLTRDVVVEAEGSLRKALLRKYYFSRVFVQLRQHLVDLFTLDSSFLRRRPLALSFHQSILGLLIFFNQDGRPVDDVGERIESHRERSIGFGVPLALHHGESQSHEFLSHFILLEGNHVALEQPLLFVDEED